MSLHGKWPKKLKLMRHEKMVNFLPSPIHSSANPKTHQLLILNTQKEFICNSIKAQAGRFYLEISW